MSYPISTGEPDHESAAGTPPPAIEAVVQTATSETVYRRAGRGPQVLLVAADGDGGPLGRALFRTLAERFRVVAPCYSIPEGSGTPPGHAEVGVWLRDVIDGLGLDRPGIVADEMFAGAAVEFARMEPDRVGRLAVICRPGARPALDEAALQDAFSRTAPPFLLLRVKAAPRHERLSTSTGTVLLAFLADEAPGPEPP
jgi:pimeloyl-ACP methyl ester carboxylesterase